MARTLETYNEKRDFRKTAEPEGKRPEKGGPEAGVRLRFVVQHHAASRDHYDFRLEWDGVLVSWAVPKGPSYNPRDKRLAVAVEDHPLSYRDFEGTIAEEEYGGGTVMLWDEGYWEPQAGMDVAEGLSKGSLKIVLDGQRLHGRWALVQMKGRSGANGENWLLIKEKDDFAQVETGIEGFTTSVRSGRTLPEIAGKADPGPARGTRRASSTAGSGKSVPADTGKNAPANTGKNAPAASGKAAPANRKSKSTEDAGNGIRPKRESIVIEKVRLTSPDKEMFAGTGITKEAVARYYLAVAGRLMPYLEKRILHFLRCPGGAPGSCFFQRHLDRTAAGIGTLEIKEKDGKLDDYFYIENKAGLISAVQMGTLELHAWGSRFDRLETPDWLVFDLDPDVGLDLACVRQGVRDVQQMLTECGLKAFLKTSGGKGYHIVAPIEPAASWDAVQAFARRIAENMEQRWPERYTSSTSKAKRQDRIYVDWLRNSRSSSSVAPYSLRARTGAPVSMPIAWSELDTIAPNDIGVEEAIRRLDEPDPWADFLKTRQRLE